MLLINYIDPDKFRAVRNVEEARVLNSVLFIRYSEVETEKIELYEVEQEKCVASIYVDGQLVWNMDAVKWQNKKDLEIQSEEEKNV